MADGLRKSILAAVVGLAVALALVCDEGKSPTSASSAPARLKYISGDNQSGQLRTRLEQPFMVQVLDFDGDPVAAHQVIFEVTSPAGTLAGSGEKEMKVLTNNEGITSVYLVLGDSVEMDYTVQASAVDASDKQLANSPYLFNALVDTSGSGGDAAPDDTTRQAEPGLTANRVQIMSGNYQGARGDYYEGQLLSMPLVVQVLDTAFAGVGGYPAEGAPVSGFPVLFTVYGPKEATEQPVISAEPGGGPGGTGLLTATTDKDGLAAVRLNLGEGFYVGPDFSLYRNNHRVEAVVVFADGSQDSVLFFATGLALAPDDTSGQVIGPPTEGATANNVRIVSGNNQGANGDYFEEQLLPMPLVVQVVDTTMADTLGYPLEGAPVSGYPVLFTVYGPEGAVENPVISAEPGGGPGGTGRLQATTDENGLAAVRLNLGAGFYAGPVFSTYLNNHRVEVVVVFADGSQDSVVFFATGLAIAPDDTSGDVIGPPAPGAKANNVYIVSGNYQGANGEYFEGQLLPMPLVVQVVDTTMADSMGHSSQGAPVAGYPVLFTVYGPEGAGVDPTINSDPGGGPGGTGLLRATTDEKGLAAVRLKLAQRFGGGTTESNQNNHRVEVVVVLPDGSQDSVLFFATAVPMAPIDTTAAVIPDAERIELIAGGSQPGVPGELLGEPVVVAVYDTLGGPVSGAEVTVILKKGGGVISSWGQLPSEPNLLSLVTDSEGMVRLGWRLGPLPELENEIIAVVTKPDGSSSSVTITATAVEPGLGPDSMALVAGDGQTGEVSTLLPLSLVVRVFNAEKIPVLGAEVVFSVIQGFGLISKAGEEPLSEIVTTVTDENGLAAASMRLGPGPGLDNVVVAEVKRSDGTVDSVTFHATALPRPDMANRLILKSGNYQGSGGEYFEGETLALPLVVRVVDTLQAGESDSPGAPIPNFPVLFTAYGPEEATVSPLINDVKDEEPAGTGRLEALTDEDGLAAVRLMLARDFGSGGSLQVYLNNHRVEAVAVFSDGTVDSVIFFATAKPVSPTDPGAPAVEAAFDLVAVSDTMIQPVEVGTILPGPLVVRVVDDQGSSVQGASVTFTVIQGGGQIGVEYEMPKPDIDMLKIITDSDGLAVITWGLGPGPDLDNVVVAQLRRGDGEVLSVRFHAEARPKSDTANRLVVMSGNYQGNYIVGTELPLPLVVKVVDTLRRDVDTLGAPMPNFPVLFQAFSPSGDGDVTSDKGTGPGGTGRLESLTDADGLAGVRLTLGTMTGAPDDTTLLKNNNHVIAVAVFADGSQDSVIFFATAVPAAPENIAAAGGTELSGIAGKSLTGLNVVVTDKYGNSTAGVQVDYVIDRSPGGGSITGAVDYTDSFGYASSGIDPLSTVTGDMKVSAVNGSLGGSPVTFTITVSADEADSILASGGDNQVGTIGKAFSKVIKVMVLDQYGNPKSGDLVTFSVTGGAASLSEMVVKTGSDGVAQTSVTALSDAMTIEAGAMIRGVVRKVTFNLTAVEEE